MTEHTITIDETGEGADQAYRPFCTDECGWQAESWSHTDAMPGYDAAVPGPWDAAETLAYADAQAAGREHLTDVIMAARQDVSTELDDVLTEVFTPESADDADESSPLGSTSMFNGHLLTPDDLDLFADTLRVHASLARLASA